MMTAEEFAAFVNEIETPPSPLVPSLRYCERVGRRCLYAPFEKCGYFYGIRDPLPYRGLNYGEQVDLGEGASIAYYGGLSMDHHQGRVFIMRNEDGEAVDCRFVPAVLKPFKISAKGRQTNRSVSFDEHGKPVWQVRALFAMKTKKYVDRLFTLEGIQDEVMKQIIDRCHDFYGWEDPELYKRAMLNNDHDQFHIIILNLGSGSDWDTRTTAPPFQTDLNKHWEHVAKDAVARSEAPETLFSDQELQYLALLKKIAISKNRIPSQNEVKEARKQGDIEISDWKQVRDSLGLAWLPTKFEVTAFSNRNTEQQTANG
jgi:hypothetical protein